MVSLLFAIRSISSLYVNQSSHFNALFADFSELQYLAAHPSVHFFHFLRIVFTVYMCLACPRR